MASLGVTTLTPNPYDIQQSLPLYTAYERCLELEARSSAHTDNWSGTGLAPLVRARLLGHLLTEVPTLDGRCRLAEDIARCDDDAELLELADLFKDHLVRLFKPRKEHNSTPAHDLKPQAMAEHDVLVEITDSTTSKILALERDGYRCMISRKIDKYALRQSLVVADGVSPSIGTQCSHIFPQLDHKGIGNNDKKFYVANVHNVMGMFDISSVEELNGTKVYRLENTLTLSPEVQESFDDMAIWLEKRPGDDESWYTLASADPSARIGLPARVQFVSVDPSRLPLPDPRYLAMQASCARVMHLSGAAEQIDRIMDESENCQVLASDGGSFQLLYHAIIAAF